VKQIVPGNASIHRYREGKWEKAMKRTQKGKYYLGNQGELAVGRLHTNEKEGFLALHIK